MNGFYKFILKIANIFYPCKIIGKENIPNGKAILSCNHFSVIDAVYMLNVYNDNVVFMAKKEIFKNKFITSLINSIIDTIPVDRENPDLKTIMTAIKVLKNDQKLAIFPEGTRNKTGSKDLQKIKGGSGIFAIKAKAPIVPIMIYEKAKLFRKNYIIVGKPFYLDNFYDKKLSNNDGEILDKIIRDKMKNEQQFLFDYLKEKGLNK